MGREVPSCPSCMRAVVLTASSCMRSVFAVPSRLPLGRGRGSCHPDTQTYKHVRSQSCTHVISDSSIPLWRASQLQSWRELSVFFFSYAFECATTRELSRVRNNQGVVRGTPQG